MTAGSTSTRALQAAEKSLNLLLIDFIFMLYPKQGLSLRSDERLTPPPLTARAPVRNERAMKGIYFFLSSTKLLEKMKKEKQS